MAEDLTMPLSAFPYVLFRLGCDHCKRRGQYRLARLAAAFGAEATAMEVLDDLTRDCAWRLDRARKRKPGLGNCGVYLLDLRSGRPPDLPPGAVRLRLVAGAK